MIISYVASLSKVKEKELSHQGIAALNNSM